MDLIEQYRRNAEAAVRQSRDRIDQRERSTWQDIAAEWLALAEAREMVVTGADAKGR